MEKQNIPFFKPVVINEQYEQLQKIIEISPKRRCSGYVKPCEKWFDDHYSVSKTFMTNSCTSALIIAAQALEMQPEDEVILPSYTFAGTANAIVHTGATPVFVDIEPNTMNIDVHEVENAISSKTKAIFCVHYGGVAADMEKLLSISKQYGLYLVEDAAHCISSYFKNQQLGSIGHMGCISFDQQKNISCGQGGALLVNDQSLLHKVEQIYENGTNKNAFLRGDESKYTWTMPGGNYKMSEINATWLYPQLEHAEEIINWRRHLWQTYYDVLEPLERNEIIELPSTVKGVTHNAHLFFIKTNNKEERSALMKYLFKIGIEARPHYIPLHSSPMGKKVGHFKGSDQFTTKESERLLRLPIYHKMTPKQVQEVTSAIFDFFDSK